MSTSDRIEADFNRGLSRITQALCDHDWETCDDSSDVEPAAPYRRCKKCDAEKEIEPESGP